MSKIKHTLTNEVHIFKYYKTTACKSNITLNPSYREKISDNAM